MARTIIIGTNQTTPGAMPYPSNLVSATGTTGPALLLKYGNASGSAPTTQTAVGIYNSSGSVIWNINKTGIANGYGMKLGCSYSVLGPFGMLNGSGTIPYFELPDGVKATGGKTFSGTGAPSASTVGTASVGDDYDRIGGSAGRADTLCGTVNTNATVTDTNAVAGDVGRSVSGTNIPVGAYITSVSAGVSFTMSVNATGTGTVTVTLSGTYYYICNTAGSPGTWQAIA